MTEPTEALLWAFQQNYHLDKANAAVHCAPVKFSPITFRLMHEVLFGWVSGEDLPPELAEVRSHQGMYDEDRGR